MTLVSKVSLRNEFASSQLSIHAHVKSLWPGKRRSKWKLKPTATGKSWMISCCATRNYTSWSVRSVSSSWLSSSSRTARVTRTCITCRTRVKTHSSCNRTSWSGRTLRVDSPIQASKTRDRLTTSKISMACQWLLITNKSPQSILISFRVIRCMLPMMKIIKIKFSTKNSSSWRTLASSHPHLSQTMPVITIYSCSKNSRHLKRTVCSTIKRIVTARLQKMKMMKLKRCDLITER